MWECPAFFPLDDKYVLLVSVWDEDVLYYTVYYTGRYENHRFIPETLNIVDRGGYFYAPQTLLDERGRRLMWGWLWEGRDDRLLLEAGWAGALSLPRMLSLNHDGALVMKPVPELQALRGEHCRLADVDILPGASNLLKGVRSNALEIVAEFELRDVICLGVKLRCSPGREEASLVVYDAERGRVGIEPTCSSLSPGYRTQAFVGSAGSHVRRDSEAPHLPGSLRRRGVCKRPGVSVISYLPVPARQFRVGSLLGRRRREAEISERVANETYMERPASSRSQAYRLASFTGA